MSQIFKTLTSGGPIPPIIPTSFVTQDGTATPSGNILIVNGEQSNEDNNNGIITKGGVVGTTVINEVDVVITNRASGTATTTSAPDTKTLITLPLDDNSTYQIDVDITAFATNGLGVMGAKETGTFYRRGGGAATVVNTVDSQQNLINLLASLSFTSASGNNVIVQAFGSPGFNIDWKALLTFTKVS